MDRVKKSYNIDKKYDACESRDFRCHTFGGVERHKKFISSGFYTDKIFEELFLFKLCSYGYIRSGDYRVSESSCIMKKSSEKAFELIIWQVIT